MTYFVIKYTVIEVVHYIYLQVETIKYLNPCISYNYNDIKLDITIPQKIAHLLEKTFSVGSKCGYENGKIKNIMKNNIVVLQPNFLMIIFDLQDENDEEINPIETEELIFKKRTNNIDLVIKSL